MTHFAHGAIRPCTLKKSPYGASGGEECCYLSPGVLSPCVDRPGILSPAAPQLRRMKELEAENTKLKRMFAELSLDHHALKVVVSKKF